MSEPKAFAVGDKVTSRHTDNEGEITYGPYTDGAGAESYLVKLVSGPAAGRQAAWETRYMRSVPPAPAFAVGDEVSTTYSGRCKVVAGPFKQRHGESPWWVVEMEDGTHGAPNEYAMTRLAAWTVGDVYRDRDGDEVKVARTANGKFVMVNVEDDNPVTSDPTPEDYTYRYGPLTKIN